MKKGDTRADAALSAAEWRLALDLEAGGLRARCRSVARTRTDLRDLRLGAAAVGAVANGPGAAVRVGGRRYHRVAGTGRQVADQSHAPRGNLARRGGGFGREPLQSR